MMLLKRCGPARSSVVGFHVVAASTWRHQLSATATKGINGRVRDFASASQMLRKVGNWLGLQGSKTTLGNARSLLFNCKAQAEKQDWFTRGLVTPDFRSKHTLLVLHIWMVHKRLQLEGKRGELVQEALFDEFWDDTCSRIRGQGINELSVNKYLEQVQGYSFRTCLELDHSLSLLRNPEAAAAAAKATADAVDSFRSEQTKSNITAADAADSHADTSTGTTDAVSDSVKSVDVEQVVLDEIGGVLWRMLYLRKEEIEVGHVLELAKYMRQEQESLQQLPTDAIFEGRITWGRIPLAWKAITASSNDTSSRSSSINNSSNNMGHGGGEWREATAADGKIYYWNTVTRESRWEKP